MKTRRNKFCNEYIISGLLIVLSSLFISCSFKHNKLNSEIPALNISILNLDELRNLPINLGANKIKIRIVSENEFQNSSKLIVSFKDGYTINYNANIPEINIPPGILDTVIIYTTKEISYLNDCDFGLIKVEVISGEDRAEFLQPTKDFGGKSIIALGDYRYFQSECEYLDGGMYKYQISKRINKVIRMPVIDQFGVLTNSGIKFSDSLITKEISPSKFMDFISICREINLAQTITKDQILNKGTGVIKFDQAKGRYLYVSHDSPGKIKLDLFLNNIYNEK